MKWLLIITLFWVDGATKVSYEHESEAICEKVASYYMIRYAEEDTKAEYECIPASPFVVKD